MLWLCQYPVGKYHPILDLFQYSAWEDINQWWGYAKTICGKISTNDRFMPIISLGGYHQGWGFSNTLCGKISTNIGIMTILSLGRYQLMLGLCQYSLWKDINQCSGYINTLCWKIKTNVAVMPILCGKISSKIGFI